MAHLSIRDLRNHGGEVVDGASRGEQVTITARGRSWQKLRPLAPPPLTAHTLLARWKRLPELDPLALRAEIDETADSRL